MDNDTVKKDQSTQTSQSDGTPHKTIQCDPHDEDTSDPGTPPILHRTDCDCCDYLQGGQTCFCAAEMQLLHQRIQQIENTLHTVWKKQETDDGPSFLSINGLQLPVNTKKRKNVADGGPVERALNICHRLYDDVNIRPTYRILRKFRFGSTTTHKALQRWHEDRLSLQRKLVASGTGASGDKPIGPLENGSA